jgi:hypothetical protein
MRGSGVSGRGRVAIFAVVLAGVFAAAAGLGAAVGPLDRGSPATGHGGHGGDTSASADGTAGLSLTANGFRLALARPTLPARAPAELAFRILDTHGEPLRDFDVAHERRLHLIVARRDLTAFFHLHPRLDRDGMWRARGLRLEPGAYRVFADFVSGGEKTVLGADLAVAGRWSPSPLPTARQVATAGPYTVELARTRYPVESEQALSFTLRRDGRSVTPGRYLGARGHLVILRDGDLAYLHAHADANALGFETTFPTAGRYRAFLQFVHGGLVRTVAFTLEVA